MRGPPIPGAKTSGKAKSSWRARRGRKRSGPRLHDERAVVFDRRLAMIAAVVTVALLAVGRHQVDPVGPAGWSWPVLTLCVVVAAAAGRGLRGFQTVPEDQERSAPKRVSPRAWCLVLAAATLPNLPGLDIGFLADDFGLRRAARLAGGFLDAARTAPLTIFHRPVSQVLWWLGLHLWNGSPLGYHVLSTLLHAGNTVLLFLLARRYIGSVLGGAMAALLFAVHPVHVEATVWTAAQPDLLCAGFALVSMLCLEKYIGAPRSRRRWLALAAALAAFLLSLWSKETAAALIGIVLVRCVASSDPRKWARATGIGAAYALTVGVYLAVRFVVLRNHWLGGYGTRLAIQNAALAWTPLLLTGQLLFPVHINMFKFLLPLYLWAAVLALMAVGLLWWVRHLVLISRHRLLLYTSYLLVPTIPVATAGLTIGADMANSRYGYLPSVGIALLFGGICARGGSDRRRRTAIGVATILVAAGLSVLYLLPWRGAARLRDDLLAEGRRVVANLPGSRQPATVVFTGIPFAHFGAPVFVKGSFAMALSPALSRPISIEEIAPTSGAQKAISASDLLPCEYLVAWRPKLRRLVTEQTGDGSRTALVSEIPR